MAVDDEGVAVVAGLDVEGWGVWGIGCGDAALFGVWRGVRGYGEEYFFSWLAAADSTVAIQPVMSVVAKMRHSRA